MTARAETVPAVGGLLRTYRALLLAQLQAAMQYRLQMFLYVFFSFMRPIIFLAAWSAVAAAQGGTVAGYDQGAFAAYFVAAMLVTHFTFAWNAYDFEYQVRQGQLSSKLLRPLHPVHHSVAENIVWKAFTAVAVLGVSVFIAITFGARFETQPWHLALGIPSVLLGAVLYFTLDITLASIAFWTTRVHAAVTLYQRAAFIFAGQIAPLALLPGPLQAVAYVLPFGYTLGVPADILRGGPTFEEAIRMVAGQVVWVVLALAIFRAVWRAGLRAYTAVGA
ncbi:MAG: ABC transporter permease [Dehalococcoidia bacterium]